MAILIIKILSIQLRITNDGIFSYIEYFDNSGNKDYSTEGLGQVISFKDNALEKVVIYSEF